MAQLSTHTRVKNKAYANGHDLQASHNNEEHHQPHCDSSTLLFILPLYLILLGLRCLCGNLPEFVAEIATNVMRKTSQPLDSLRVIYVEVDDYLYSLLQSPGILLSQKRVLLV